MKNTLGNSVTVTLFGESHGKAIGAVIDGLAPGIEVDEEFISSQLDLRRPVGSISTPRVERDEFEILSGVFEGKTTGTPVCIVIPNENTKSDDYSEIRCKARPSHADFTAYEKYHGYEDFRGGGHFSGRITAAIVAAGAIAISALRKKGIYIGTHISRCAGISDIKFADFEKDILELNKKEFAVLNDTVAEDMKNAILKAKSEGDSVGGILETAVIGMPTGVGEPWFDSVESLLSHALFSVPAIKGVEFGAGFSIADMKGSIANDPFKIENGKVITVSNNNGGINGGITNGMPVIFRCAVKPTPTIGKTQETVDFINIQNTEIEGKGRHDPCIVHRARVVVDSITALVISDILGQNSVQIGWLNMEYGLIGEKLGHSFSKIIHTNLCGYDYSLCEIPKGELDSFMKKKEFKAINVTIPYKQDVMPYLDQIDENAKQIGAVNTVVNKNGKLYGYNTDFSGLSELIKRANINIENKKVLILGSGATSKTAFCVAKTLGAREILKVSRNASDSLITYDDAVLNHNDAEIIINTTPCGMYPDINNVPIDIDEFKKLEGVVDVIYNPLCTQLVISAKEKGINAVGGLYMLVSQAAFAAEKFVGKKIDDREIERIFNKLLSEKRNLVLIGMPSCGKTTVGKAISKQLNMEFIDSDELIVNKAGMPIPEIFKTQGETGFRKIESDVIAEISALQNTVIATGGGAVLNVKNTRLLKSNGFVIFLDRPLEKLITTSDRPLSSDRQSLEKRYNERYDIYCKSADVIIDASGSVKENINAVKEVFML